MRKSFFFIRQWATRLVYSNRLCQGIYQTFSGFGAKRRRRKRAANSLHQSNHSDANLAIFERYQREYSELPGWFDPESQALWGAILSFQAEKIEHGNMLEIGVFRGKSAACSTLHAREKETCVFIDPIVLAEFKDTINSIRTSNNLIIQTPSARLGEFPEVAELGATFRWIHIDGEHSGVAVQRDLAVAHSLLGEHGIICIDDFPSCAYPQILFAVTDYLREHPSLTMFACGHNKGYVCRQVDANDYLMFVKNDLHREMTARGGDVTIWKSGRPSDSNCFGITARVEMFDYRGPDWNLRQIEI